MTKPKYVPAIITAFVLALLTPGESQSSSENLVLSFDGLGAIRLGASVRQVRRLRPEIKLWSSDTGIHQKDIPEQMQSCVDVNFSENPSVFGLQIQHSRIYRIDVVSNSKAETKEGIKLGSTEDDIRRAYGGPAYKDRLVEGDSTIYSVNTETGRGRGRDGRGHAFLINSEDGRRAIVIETDGVQVVAMHAGYIKAFPRDLDDGSIKVISCTDLVA